MDDLISRQAAIEALDVGAEYFRRVLDLTDIAGVDRENCERVIGLIEAQISDIKELPSAQPKTGHWIMTRDYFTGAYESIDYVKCSCCGEDSLEMGDYCPNCGAKMIEP